MSSTESSSTPANKKPPAPKATRYMSDGITLKRDYYEQVFCNGTMDLADISKDRNPSDPNAPNLNTLKGWAQKHKWRDKRQYSAGEGADPEPVIVREIEGRLEQVRRAYNPQLVSDEGRPAKHYSDNLNDQMRPYYLAALQDNDLLKLEREIAYASAMMAKHAEEQAMGGTVEDWKAAQSAWKEYREAAAAFQQSGDQVSAAAMKVAFKNVGRAINTPLSKDAEGSIAYWIEIKRKLSATEVKRAAEAQNYLNVNEAMRMAGDKLGRVMQVIADEKNPTLSRKVCSVLGIDAG